MIDRRKALALLASVPTAAAFSITAREVESAHRALQKAAGGYAPTFFDHHEYETVRLLVDLLIPGDERSGSATDAGVPEFIDFMMTDEPERQIAMRGGLAWLDNECLDRFGSSFVEASAAERTSLLDEIAWPERASPELSHGVGFFNAFRDLTATGFFTSRMGMEDLDYRGNVYVTEWTGCPPEALRKLGLEP
ncbi:MAG TPA: gluconate 2-dehydrogenase subunit 3 family protein [Vicinamibacteria bacterium]|nr:gluconate 2-dehydrogenase subunit 3 family protein [Vicinamibacteria bacterium]